MQQSRLIRLLSTLSGPELRRFQDFLRSPYHNQLARAAELVNHLAHFAPHYEDEDLDSWVIFQHLFPQEPLDSLQPLHALSSQVNRLLEKFLAVDSFLTSEDAVQLQLLKSLTTAKRSWYFGGAWKKATAAEPNLERNAQYWLKQFQMWELGVQQSQLAKKRQGSDSQDERLEQALAALDRFYLAQKLQLSCESLNRKKIVNTDVEPELLDQLTDYLLHSPSELKQEPFIQLYLQVLLLLREGGDDEYFELLRLLQIHQATLSRPSGFSLYTYAQNYCIRQINLGRQEFLQELFALYQQLLHRGFLLEEDNSLAHWHYKNITTVALRLQQFTWVKSFLEEYKVKLSEELRESVYTYNLAAAYYESGEYGQAMRLLQQTDFTDVYYDLSARSMLLKIFYEMREDDSLGYTTKAFEVFLRRNKDISQDHYLIHKNLVRFVKKLHRLRNRYEALPPEERDKRSQQLLSDMESSGGTANLGWLKAKLAEISASEA